MDICIIEIWRSVFLLYLKIILILLVINFHRNFSRWLIPFRVIIFCPAYDLIKATVIHENKYLMSRLETIWKSRKQRINQAKSQSSFLLPTVRCMRFWKFYSSSNSAEPWTRPISLSIRTPCRSLYKGL